MVLTLVCVIDEDVIQIYNTKDIKIFCQNFINIILKACWYIKKFKWHYIIFKIAIIRLEYSFLFVIFLDSY